MPASRTRSSVSRRSRVVARRHDFAVELRSRVEVVVVVVEARVAQLLGLPVLQHAQRRARLQAQRLHFAHHGEHRFQVALLRAAPRSAHAEPRSHPPPSRRAPRRTTLVDVQHRLVVDAGVKARGLRTIAAVLRAAAGLDRDQRGELHGVRCMVRAMHLLRPVQEIVERQRQQRVDGVDAPARRSCRSGRCGRRRRDGGRVHWTTLRAQRSAAIRARERPVALTGLPSARSAPRQFALGNGPSRSCGDHPFGRGQRATGAARDWNSCASRGVSMSARNLSNCPAAEFDSYR